MRQRHCMLFLLSLLGCLATQVKNSFSDSISETRQPVKEFTVKDTASVNKAITTLSLLIDSDRADTAIAMASDVLHSCKQIHYKKGEALTKFLLGKAFIHKFAYAGGLKWIMQADTLFKSLHDQKGIADCRLQHGVILMSASSNYRDALAEFTEAGSIYSKLGDEYNTSKAEYLEGLCYTHLGNYKEAEKKLLAAEQVKKKINDEDGLYEIHNGLADLYFRTKEYSKSKEYYKECLDYFQKTKNPLGFAHSASGIITQMDLLSEQIRNEKIIRYLLLGGVILLIALVFMSFQRYRYKQQANKRLEKANQQLQEANDSLSKALNVLKSTQEQLIQSEKMASLGQLTAGVAHEINNPINFVSSSINPLKRNYDEVKRLLESYENLLSDSDKKNAALQLRKDFDLEQNLSESENLLNGIEEGSRRTAEIVKGLRNFSRLDEEEMKKVNINDGIESTLVLLQNKLKHQNIEVIKSLGNLAEIDGYPGQLNQVLLNLLANAIDAIGSDGKIFISTWKEKNFVGISIRDTGKGMNEEVKQKIFDPFFTTKEVGKGTGLGLSISYGIIEKHNGKIEVKSAPEKGTEFIITLPAV